MMNQIRTFIFCMIVLIPALSLKSQAEFPELGPVFRDDMVPRVDITIDQDTLDWIYENVDSYEEFRCEFKFTTDTLQETLSNVGFRLRGNTSRNSWKKSFKLSFNTFESGRDFYGLEKVNLNGEHNDPSIIRAKIGWDLMNSFGIPGSRANHVEVYINGNYYGLYIQVEHIDEEFVNSRYDTKNGNLYKCLWPADLDYRGSSPDDYKYMQGDRRVYDLKTNVAEDDYSDIANFIAKLNQLPNEVFACEIQKVFNVYDYLRVIATDVFLGNWDGPIYNKNNFYLYYNTSSNRIEYIPYDLDNTLGIDWIGRDWKTRDMYDWAKHGEPRPLYTKMMANEELRAIYTQYTSVLMNELVNEDFMQRILALKEMITPYVENDPYYPMDYEYSMDDFHNSYYNAIDDHTPVGIFPYIEARKQATFEQLESFEAQAIINHVRYKAKDGGEDLRIRAYVREVVSSVKIRFTANDGSVQELEMYDDGNHNDIDAGDGIYGNTIDEIPLGTQIRYQILAKKSESNQTLQPCEAILYHYRESTKPLLKINEFMASNDTTIYDEYGNSSDWIEVYNADNSPVYLGDKYLTDNISDESKWRMPSMTLAPGDFVLFWADGDVDEGTKHTNFKLSKSGEEIGIFDADYTGHYPLDTLVYGQQSTDVSQGRFADGEDVWKFYSIPTPGFSNIVDDIDEYEFSQSLRVYPNPNNRGRLFLSHQSDIEIYSINGRLLIQAYQVQEVNLDGLVSGVYLVKDQKGNIQKLIIQ